MQMIGAVKNTEDKRCIICLSRKKTVDVGFQNENNIGIWFTLCKECADDLVKTIKGAYENE